ncbi:MAG: peptidoglycan DD-metalloendopeptidase family protein [Pseudomonadota bacterium]
MLRMPRSRLFILLVFFCTACGSGLGGDRDRVEVSAYEPASRAVRAQSPNPPRPRSDSVPDSVIASTHSYSVVRGDTLYELAHQFGVPSSDLIRLNQLEPPYRLLVGQVLRIPEQVTHLVKTGETLSEIALMYQVSMASLASRNSLSAPWIIQIGQKLHIPGRVNSVSRTSQQASAGKQGRASIIVSERHANGFLWPVQGRIVVPFGPGANGIHNDGIKIAAKAGSRVRAAESGIVAYSGSQVAGLGNLVLIRHADQYISAYAHNSSILVKPGDRIVRGQVIALAGATGDVERPQLHFEIRKGSRALDPLRYLKAP